jgi:hypothetical protein
VNRDGNLSLLPFPNPASGTMYLPFRLEASTRVTVDLFDFLGKKIARLMDETRAPLLTCSCTCDPFPDFDCVEFSTRSLASGVYFARLQFDGRREYRKMIIVR